MIENIESIIFYFEGSCEICLANRGIEKYRAEVEALLNSGSDFGDDMRLRLYHAHALIEYKTNNIDGALAAWLKARDYAESTGDRLYLGKIYSFLSICYYINEDKAQEKYCFHMAEEIFKEQQTYGELASHYINILWYKRYEKDKKEILEYLDKAFDYVQMSGSMKNARVYLHLGYIYKTIFSDYTKCIGYLVKSNELCREFGFTEMESMTFHVLADVYTKIDKPVETIRIYTDILDNDKFKNITPNLKAAILCSLAGCYIKIHDLQNAEKYLAKLDSVLPDVQTNIKEQYRALMLGLKAEYMNLAGGDNEQALLCVLEAENIYMQNQKNFIVEEFAFMTASRKGDLYLALGDYDNALRSYREMEELAAGIGRHELKTAYEKLAHFYEVFKNYGESLCCYKKANDVCNEIARIHQDIQYETIYKEFIKQVREQERINLLKLNTTLEQQGNIDALTNVFNRNYLNGYIETMACMHKDSGLSLMMIDIDCLKKYNDIYGHIRGDEAIKSITDVFKKRCRSTDRIIRYGGDEFLIVLEDTDRDDALALARELIENVIQLKIDFEYFDIKGSVTVSIGVSTCPPTGDVSLESLIRDADRALYHSKSIGRCDVTHIDEL